MFWRARLKDAVLLNWLIVWSYFWIYNKHLSWPFIWWSRCAPYPLLRCHYKLLKMCKNCGEYKLGLSLTALKSYTLFLPSFSYDSSYALLFRKVSVDVDDSIHWASGARHLQTITTMEYCFLDMMYILRHYKKLG